MGSKIKGFNGSICSNDVHLFYVLYTHILFHVFPETICKGLFNQIHRKFKNGSLSIYTTSSIFP